MLRVSFRFYRFGSIGYSLTVAGYSQTRSTRHNMDLACTAGARQLLQGWTLERFLQRKPPSTVISVHDSDQLVEVSSQPKVDTHPVDSDRRLALLATFAHLHFPP